MSFKAKVQCISLSTIVLALAGLSSPATDGEQAGWLMAALILSGGVLVSTWGTRCPYDTTRGNR